MSDRTGIPYVDATWSPVVGCTKCSPGCLNCYAEKMAYRLACMGQKKYQAVVKGVPSAKPFWKKGFKAKWTNEVFCDEKALDIPLHWRQPRRILVPSMGDLFHPKVPFEFIKSVLGIIALCPQHKVLLLTKRIERAAELFGAYPDNAHLGVTICNQKEADEILLIALQIPGFDWISFEPLLSDIDFSDYMGEYLGSETCSYGDMHKKRECECTFLGNLKFAVVGCESGPNRRPCELEWIKSIVDQCKATGVGCFVKQMEINGKVSHKPDEWPAWARIREKL